MTPITMSEIVAYRDNARTASSRTPRPRLIGIGGRLASGKDTVADHLVAKHGFTKIGMSDPLLRAALILNPMIVVDNYVRTMDMQIKTLQNIVAELGYTEAKKIREVRRFLQVLGTDFGRNMIGVNVWVDMAAQTIDYLLAEGKSVVVTGLRFGNELSMVRTFAGDTWWVDRFTPDPNWALHAHQSEQGVNQADFDRTIYNDGTLEELYLRVDNILDETA